MGLLDIFRNRATGAETLVRSEISGTHPVNPEGRISDQVARLNADRAVTVPAALSLPSVYRAVTILASTISQLPLYVERNGSKLSEADTPSLIKDPTLTGSRSDFIEQLVTSMALRGNAFFITIGDLDGSPAALRVLNPDLVGISWDEKRGEPVYSIDGKTYRRQHVAHLALLCPPGRLLGVGPIQAAREELAGILDTRNFAAHYFDRSGQPAGILSATQAITAEDALAARNSWNELDNNGHPRDMTANPSHIKVLGNGFSYSPLGIAPKDAQWIEARQYDTATIASLFGIPPRMLGAAMSGSSLTYENATTEAQNFVTYTLTQYTRKIEEALSRFTVRGQKVRFNFEGLLRTSTVQRYQAHQIALAAGFITVNEVREIEGLPPLENPITPQPADSEAVNV
ncbi:MAG: phage portal protein [Varibaculum sp.]|nr:phage portal protein [Varibaculum sp.]